MRLFLRTVGLIVVFVLFIDKARAQQPANNNGQPTTGSNSKQSPQPIATASYVSLDGLTLVVIFDKPVNLSAYVELVERRRQNEAEAEFEGPEVEAASNAAASPGGAGGELLQVRTMHPHFEAHTISSNEGPQSTGNSQQQQCSELNHLVEAAGGQETQELVHGIQLCARLLTKKTLKLLHKYRLYDCIWPSRVQFLIQLQRPALQQAGQPPIKIAFQRQTISEFSAAPAAQPQDHEAGGQEPAASNAREISLELNRLPLEGLGVPLQPRLAITGPNQVPSCGQFVLSAHLSSPFGTQPDEGVKLSWSVERVGFMPASAQLAAGGAPSPGGQQPPMMLFNGSQLSPAVRANQMNADGQAPAETRWKSLQQLVGSSRANSLVLDSSMLQFSPQIYEFRLSATFSTSLTSLQLNASHQVSRLDFETPIGSIYGSHILGQHAQLNTNQELLLLADIQVPDCAQNIKQVGLYWQVSDSRVRFEQTYAPYYLSRPQTLPEQSQLEFRLNLFYGIRVKKFSSTSAYIATGDSMLDAQISGGALVLQIGQDSPSQQLELLGGAPSSFDQHQVDKYTYQWSCFDGKTAQPCFRSSKQLEAAALSNSSNGSAGSDGQRVGAPLQSGLPLIDRQQQRQVNLRLPLGWLDPDAQLWFGLQRFDRQQLAASGAAGSTSGGQPGQQQQQPSAQTEYALVELKPGHSASLAIGPVLIGAARQQRATLRNPLTGAILLLANSPALVVGRLSPAHEIRSFVWHSPNYMGQLHWTWRNATNPQTGQQEIYTELHLSAQQLIAHAHSQIQLVACTRSGSSLQSSASLPAGVSGSPIVAAGSSSPPTRDDSSSELMTASLNLDTVQSVSQCRVSANLLSQQQQQQQPQSLAVSVEHCNIPLGLSPVTYQVYLVDTSGLDGFMAENNPPAGNGAAGSTTPTAAAPADDYTNEADVAYLESQAQPLTMPQLSPVFVLNGLNPLSLAALFGSAGAQQANEPASNGSSAQVDGGHSVRFGGRVCDRLQTCRTFYSPPINLRQLLKDWQLRQLQQSTAAASSNQSLPLALALQQQQQAPAVQQFGRQQASSLLQSLQTMLDSSKRANMAGNSIGAISILNAAITLGQRLLVDGDTELQQAPSKLLLNFRDRVGDLMQVAMRDCLHYGQVSMQRQFHYTDSGQTNLVLHSLSRILALPQSNIELKFRSLKLIGQLSRRTIQEQLSLKTNCLADLKTIQRAYESLFGTFTHYAIDSSDATADNQSAGGNLDATGNNSLTSDTPSEDPQSSANVQQQQQQQQPSGSSRQQQWANYSSGGGRRKRGQEAALAYLKSVRQAYRSLLAAAAIQISLGEAHQFRFVAAPAQLMTTAGSSGQPVRSAVPAQNNPPTTKLRHRSDHLRSAEASTSTTTTTTSDDTNGNGDSRGANKQGAAGGAEKPPRTAATTALLAPPLISSDILSSLTHLTGASDLLATSSGSKRSSIDVNFNQLGVVSITFDQRFLQRLSTLVKEGRLLCRNDTGAPGKSTATPISTTGTLTTATASTTTATSPPNLSTGGAGGQFSTLSSGNCSSFVLALTSFAGKAPFRSLDEGQSLRVPHIEVNLLSPLDGSDLLGLPQQQEALQMASYDIKTEVTFTIPNGLDGGPQEPEGSSGSSGSSSHHAARRRSYKCYQFDEDQNEWIRVAQGERQEVEQLEKRLRCTFNGLGVFAAFQGKPPPAEAPLKSPVVIGLLGLIALIIIISVSLCCCSSSSGSRSEGGAGSGSSSNNSTGSDGAEDDKRAIQRHPEQTYRSDFDYPRVGGG